MTSNLQGMDDFRELVEKSLDGLLVHREGTILYANPSLCSIVRVAGPSELIGTPLLTLLAPGEPSGPALLEYSDHTELPIRVRLLNKSGAQVVVEAAPPQRVQFGGRAALLLVVRDISERQRLEKEVLDASSRERQRLAHDLHDGLGQELGGIAFKARALQDVLDEKLPEEAPGVADIVKLLSEALSHVRALAHGLDPAVERQSFPNLIEKLLANTQRLFRVSCRLAVEGTIHVESATVAQNLYRMVQESVHNAIRHGRARNIEVKLSTCDGFLMLLVSDDGVGFSANKTHSGMGLRVMHHRNHAMGGSLQIVARPCGGTEVRCRVPLQTT